MKFQKFMPILIPTLAAVAAIGNYVLTSDVEDISAPAEKSSSSASLVGLGANSTASIENAVLGTGSFVDQRSPLAPEYPKPFSEVSSEDSSDAPYSQAIADSGGTSGGPTLAAEGDRTPSSVNFTRPTGIAVDASGNLYVTDSSRHIVRKISTNLTVSTWAGTSGSPGSQDGTGTGARLSSPKGITLAPDGNLYVADTGNARIRKLTPAGGVVSTSANVTGQSVTVNAAGEFYVADTSANLVRKVSANGMTVVGFAGVTSGNSGFAKIHPYQLSGDIDPVDPAHRLADNPRGTWGAIGQDQAEGLAPNNVTEGIYGVRLELTEDNPVSISYNTTDYPFQSSWWSHALPFTGTYGRSWVIPILPPHTGVRPIGEPGPATYDSQMWYFGMHWVKRSANVVRVDLNGATTEVNGDMTRIIRLTFLTANSGTFTTQYGIRPVGQIYFPGITELAKIHTTSSGTFVINRTAQITPETNSQTPATAVWIE